MKLKYLLLVLTTIFLNCNINSQSLVPPKLHILASGNTMGYLKPCG